MLFCFLYSVSTYFFSLTSGLETEIGKLISEKQTLLLKSNAFQNNGMAIIKSLETMIKSENIAKGALATGYIASSVHKFTKSSNEKYGELVKIKL